MTAAQLRSMMRVLVLAVVVVVPLVFWRGVADPFEVVKATLLWLVGLLLVATVVMYVSITRIRMIPRPVLIVTGALLSALVIATATSMSPVASVVGQPNRFTGLGTYVCLIAVFLAAALAFDSGTARRFAWVCTLVALPVANYALLQVSGHDPFAWRVYSFTTFWMSTLANPNIAAAFMAIVLPLVAYTMLRADAPTWVSILGGFTFGASVACLSVFSSFQGPAAALTTVVFLVAWAVWSHASLGDWIVAVLLAGFVLIVPAMQPTAPLMIISGSAAAALLTLRPMISRLRAPDALRAHRRGIAITVIGSVVVVLAVGARRAITYVEQGISSGFLERGDFYRTASSIFGQHPVLGSGLETFGLLFGRERPEGHALRFEQWLSTSPHSVPLGMFSNGGVVLGLSYLAFVAVIGWTLFRCLRVTSAHERILVGAIGSAWLAFQVQSLVSIENVTLFTLHFALSGVIVALGIEHGVFRPGQRIHATDDTRVDGDDGADESFVAPAARSDGQRGHLAPGAQNGETALTPIGAAGSVAVLEPVELGGDDYPVALRRVPSLVMIGAVVVCLTVWWTVAARPIRSLMAAESGSIAATVDVDGERAIREYSRALELAPWMSNYRVIRADIQQILGRRDEAIVGLTEVLGTTEGNPYLLEQAGRVAFAAGDDELGLALLEQGLATNPKAPNMRRRAADYYLAAAERAAEAGEVDVARNRYLRALELEPDLPAAQQALSDL